MGRSGTSALTRVLSLCGAALPPGLVGGLPGNPLGYWEPRKAVLLNEAILRRYGSAWYDPTLRLQAEGLFGAEEKAANITKIRKYLATLPAAPLTVIKDPWITAVSSMWFEAARLAGFDVAAVIAVRHPQEVIASVESTTKHSTAPASPELSGALWLKYSLLAERHTRGVPRVFVEYRNLLDNWRQEVKRVSAALKIHVSTGDENSIDRFLKEDQRHQQHCGPVTELCGTDWISAVYETLSAAARDEPFDGSVLERVFSAYEASERGFRAVFESFYRLHKLNRPVMPSFKRATLEVLAIAHRRRGTWA
jgi:hypothetical protein